MIIAVPVWLAWLDAQVTEDEEWARAASSGDRLAEDPNWARESGARWCWVTNGAEEVADLTVPTFGADSVAEEGEPCWLATFHPRYYRRQSWESEVGRPARRLYTETVVKMDHNAGGHIIRHDPHRVLAEVEAYYALRNWVLARQSDRSTVGDDYWYPLALKLLSYADRPGYDPSWCAPPRPEPSPRPVHWSWGNPDDRERPRRTADFYTRADGDRGGVQKWEAWQSDRCIQDMHLINWRCILADFGGLTEITVEEYERSAERYWT